MPVLALWKEGNKTRIERYAAVAVTLVVAQSIRGTTQKYQDQDRDAEGRMSQLDVPDQHTRGTADQHQHQHQPRLELINISTRLSSQSQPPTPGKKENATGCEPYYSGYGRQMRAI